MLGLLLRHRVLDIGCSLALGVGSWVWLGIGCRTFGVAWHWVLDIWCSLALGVGLDLGCGLTLGVAWHWVLDLGCGLTLGVGPWV